MRETLDYTFEVSLSTEKFDHKPTDSEVKRLRFKKTQTDVSNFLSSIFDGYCYASVFSSDSFCMTDKDKEHFKYSYIVSIDVDHSSESMNELVGRLEYKPTFAYTSCNDGLDGESRFRMVYCFDDKIASFGEYEGIVLSIFNANGLDINEVVGEREKVDKRGKKIEKVYKYDRGSKEAYRYFNGNGTDTFEFTTTDIIYSKEDFSNNILFSNNTSNNNLKNNINNNISINKMDNKNHIQVGEYNMCLDVHFLNKQFEEDYWKMSMGDIISKYQPIFPNMEHTPLPTVDDDTPYIQFPSDYIEIRRYWTARNDGRAIKLKDGQGRRRKLFINGVLRRRINPSITFDNLLFNLLYELYYYISNYNAKNVIDKKVIYEIAKNVMEADISLIKTENKRKFIVNRAYCIKYGISPSKVRNEAAKEIRRQQIGVLYDCFLTDKENSELMKKYDLKVSPRTISRWRKENGVQKCKKIKQNKNQ